MIPTNSTLNEGTTTTYKGDTTKEPQDNREAEKQVVVNNFYIPNGEGGWKRLETGEIPPVSPAILGEKADINYKTTSNSGNAAQEKHEKIPTSTTNKIQSFKI